MKRTLSFPLILLGCLAVGCVFWLAQTLQPVAAVQGPNYPLDPANFNVPGTASPFGAPGMYRINASKNNPAPILTKPDNSTITGEFFTSTGGEIAVFTFASIDIPAGVTVVGERNANSRPIALLSKGTITIAGTVDVSGGDGAVVSDTNVGAAGGAAGPGGGGGGGGGGAGNPDFPVGAGGVGGVGRVNGGNGANSTGTFRFAAGGAGGNVSEVPNVNGAGLGGNGIVFPNVNTGTQAGGGAYGGAGGNGITYGDNNIQYTIAGGTAYGNLVTKLQGGSGGGGATPFTRGGEGGGGGGGAVELGATSSITLSSTGKVYAKGGNAQGGAGGGAGGGILLHSTVVDISQGMGLNAAGGESGFAGGGGGGRISILANSFFPSQADVAAGAGNLNGQIGVYTTSCNGPNRLAFVQQPTPTTPNTALNPAVTVQVLTACGELVTNGPTVTLSLNNANGATLSGNSAVADANGIATFSNLRVSRAGTGYTLTADSPSVTSATSATFNIICPTITVNPSSPTIPGGFVALTSGTIGVSYSQTFTQTGGATPVQFSQLNGILPPGMTLTGNVLSGVPADDGTYEFTIQVTDSSGCTGLQQYQLVVNCPPFTLNTPTASASVGVSYNSSVTASPALPQGFSYRYRVIGLTSLPDGLTLDQNTGIISGVPTTNGSFPFTVSVDLGGSCGQTANYTISVGCASNPVVTNLNDAGAGSLREAIDLACAGATITFQSGLSGTLALTSSQLLISKNLSIQGPAADSITLSGGQARRVLRVESGATVKLERLTLANGQAADNGGGISNSGNLTLQDCTLSGNTATGGGSVNNGGGIYNNGTLAIINCTLTGNTASGGSTVNQGGGLYNDSTGICTITNSTIAGNTVIQGSGFLNVGGGIFNNSSGQVKVRNSIIAKNTAQGFPDGRGTFTSLGNNLVGTGASGFSSNTNDQTGTTGSPLDPKLELDGNGNPKLANNGGPTQTIRLKPGSPAINGGANCVLDNSCAADPPGFSLITDQRGMGFARGVGQVDIGAYEVQAGIPDHLAFSVQPANTNAGTPFSVTVQVLDVLNSLVNSSTAAISLAFGNNPTSATLGGTTSVAAVAGQAVFSGLSVNLPGTGYTLVASSGELVSATSNAFDISFACPTITVNPASLPGGTVGANYSQTFTQTGGSGSIAYSKTLGTLPPGLTLTAAGDLSGNLTQSGSFTFTITATDNNNCSGSREYQVQVNCPANLPNKLYVNAAVAPGGDGSSWGNALPTLSQALALANTTCYAVSEIWVARGTYKPAGPNGDRNATFTLRNGLAIYGGFTSGQTSLSERDANPATNGTVLSGDLNGNDGANFANNSENSIHVVTGGGTNSTAILDGFTIQGGNTLSTRACPDSCGGGMYNDNSSPTLNNLRFNNNQASLLGGGLANLNNSRPTLTGVSFSGNSAGSGGGMANNRSRPMLINVSFTANSATIGGGMSNSNDGSPTLLNVSFSGNSAMDFSGGMDNDDNSSPTLTNVIFSGNSAGNTGGAMFNNNSSSPILTNVTLSGNSAPTVGGINNRINSNPQLRNCILWGDSDVEISNQNSTPAVSYSIVQGTTVYPGTGNRNTDPLFVTPVPAAPSTGGNLRLGLGSPAINQGNNDVLTPALPSSDLAGNARIAGSTVDMGAYESSFVLAVISGTPQSTTVNTTFANALQVRLTEYNQPLSGKQLSFSAPGSGASAALSNGGLATTDAQGYASVTATANSVTGSYQVTASASATGPSVSFSLTNLCTAPVVSNVQPSPPTCFGAANGSLTVQASGVAPLQYSRNNGQTFQSSNVFTSLAASSYQIVVKDANGCLSTPVPVVLSQPQALSFTTTPSNPTCNGVTNGSLTINAAGGTGALQYSINGGQSFGPNPQFTGLAAGLYPVVVKDAQGCQTAASNVTLTAPAALALSPAALSPAVAGQLFTQAFTPSGGTGTKSVSLQGALPNWLSFNAASATLSGTAPTPTTVSFTLVVTDAANCTASFPYTLTFVCPTLTLGPVNLPNATINTAYPQALTASPAGGNYSFALTSGLLPTGLTLNGDGTFSGAPTQSGSFNFRVTVTGFGTCSSFRDYILLVNCPGVTVNPASLPGGTLGTAYNQSVSASPAGTYSYSVTSGALPGGVTLNSATGALTGTPTASGTFNFTITAMAGSCAGSRSYTVAIVCAGVSFMTTSLPGAQAGVSLNQTLQVSPAGSYTFSLVTGNLPPGLNLNPATGQLSGTPAATGTYTFSVQALAANGCGATQAFTLAVTCPALTVNPASLPNGAAGTAYNQSLTATPTGNYSFTKSSGTLPPGLSLSAAGSLSGTPTTAGSYTFTVTATGFGSCSGSRSYTLTIGSSCAAITLPALPTSGTIGANYTGNLAATTPSGTYTFTVENGALPPGLAIDNLFAQLRGKPTAAGTYTFTLKATRNNGCTGTREYTLTVGSGALTALARTADYDGDGKSDLSLWSSQSGRWQILRSSDDQAQTLVWGGAGDVTLLGDYDGDGQSDLAVFRPANGTWYVKRSGDGNAYVKAWGAAADVPVPGDYDGDGRTDLAVWRPSEGNWYVLKSSDGGYEIKTWGLGSAPYLDVPVPGDYDGDGQTDLAVFRRQTGTWLIQYSRAGQVVSQAWGGATDVPVVGDYDGDGKADLAVWRGATGEWFVRRSSDQGYRVKVWGAASAGDVPTPGDYDGDGQTDLAVWRASEGKWYVWSSGATQSYVAVQGGRGDSPVVLSPTRR